MGALQVLVVGGGDLCRSPVAAALLRAGLGPGAAVRRAAVPARGQDDDVVDPHRRSRRTHRAALDQVEVAVSSLLAAVGR